MISIKSEYFVASFQFLCWSAVLIMVSYWIYIFNLNEELCLVDYKSYLDNKDDEPPVLSICLKNPISEDKLKINAPQVDVDTYLSFVNESHFNSALLDIDYQKIILNMSQYTSQTNFVWKNGSESAFSKIEIFKAKNPFIFNGRFYQCYELQLTSRKGLTGVWLKLNSSVFGDRTIPQNYDIMTVLHYPNQLLSSVGKKDYITKRESNDQYIMRYRLDGVEVLKRRNKRSHPCQHYENFDASIIENHIKKVGCRASYQHSVDGVPICLSENDMKNASWKPLEFEYGIDPPCKTMESIYYTYMEADLSGNRYGTPNIVHISINAYDQKFKEIVQTRYVDNILFSFQNNNIVSRCVLSINDFLLQGYRYSSFGR